MGTRYTRLALSAAVTVWLCGRAPATRAATSLSKVRFSPDITVVLNGTAVAPHDVAEDNLAGSLSLVNVGSIPPGAHITAYQLLTNGNQLLAFDTSVNLGGLIARAGDIVRFNGATYSVFFDAAAHGVPEGAIVDAVALGSGADLLLSFDTTVELGAVTAEDEDLVRFDGSTFTLAFDGSAAGVPPQLDLDAATYLEGNGHLLLSFDGSGTVGSPPVAFDDEDVLEYDPTAGTWELAYDGSARASGWGPADLVALCAAPVAPTPSATSMPTNTPLSTSTPTRTPLSTPTNTPLSTSTPTRTPTIEPTTPAVETPSVTATPPKGTATPPEGTATATPIQSPVSTQTQTATPSMGTTPTGGPACAGDCNGDSKVVINELITGVNIALGSLPVSACPAFENAEGKVDIAQLIKGVNNALNGCGTLP